jgi:hypothetical protein
VIAGVTLANTESQKRALPIYPKLQIIRKVGKWTAEELA